MTIKLTDDMKKAIDNSREDNKTCFLATAGKEGWPSLGFRGSMMAFSDTQLAYWERGRRDGLQHINENPKVLVWYFNPDVRTLWKFYGHATVHETGHIRDEVMRRRIPREVNFDPEGKGCAVVIELDAVQDGSGKAIMTRDGAKIPGIT